MPVLRLRLFAYSSFARDARPLHHARRSSEAPSSREQGLNEHDFTPCCMICGQAHLTGSADCKGKFRRLQRSKPVAQQHQGEQPNKSSKSPGNKTGKSGQAAGKQGSRKQPPPTSKKAKFGTGDKPPAFQAGDSPPPPPLATAQLQHQSGSRSNGATGSGCSCHHGVPN
ncbi:hypothetical protein V5799_025698 [Amblyomma americanum]|uniref:Uncharacterized protein n=1 Tax=Amblyomma americanum TaxID=6943 RepID=A0AAQ4E8J2_AMBAM